MTYAKDATGPFYHGTRADLAPGDWLTPGNRSNYADRKLSWIYFSGTLDAAIWGCKLARVRGASASTWSSRPARSRSVRPEPVEGSQPHG